MDDDVRALLNAGYETLREKIAAGEALHAAAGSEFAMARKYHRGARAFFAVNMLWALLNLWLSYQHVPAARPSVFASRLHVGAVR